MKIVHTAFTILLLFVLFNTTGNTQPIFKEDFSYVAGTNLNGHGGWVCFNGYQLVKVTSPGLKYLCYVESNIGNAITITGLNNVNLYNNSFKTIISSNVYTSFMINVRSIPAQSGSLTFHFGNGIWGNFNNVTLFLRKSVKNGFNFGIANQGTIHPTWSSTYNFGQTYLLVFKYSFIKGSQNNQVSLFVNPDICTACIEPSPTLITNNNICNDNLNNTEVYLSPDASECIQSSLIIDGIRIDTTWCNVTGNGGGGTLPVELSSFAGTLNGRDIQLNWETKTEKNSNIFVIEKMNSDWDDIGSVKAADLSNSSKMYSFTDKNLQAGKYQYRLKMIDNDGTYSYGNVIEIELSFPKSFQLNQNYPNPFNPSTKISYNLPTDSKVILEVYNISGEMVGQLVNGDQPGGYYTVDFSPASLKKNISSGIYFYRLLAVDKISGFNFSSIKKMVLLK